MIYFDNSATTLMHPLAMDSYMKTSQKIFGNPSSLHRLGMQATRLLSQSRKQIAELLEVSSSEIYFTSGGTESNNWVIKGTAMAKKDFGNHLIISAIEHPAVRKNCEQLEQLGFKVDYLPVDKNGFVQVEKLTSLICKETILISVMAVNNEIGSVQSINEIGEILNDYPNIHFHIDAVQAVGKIPHSVWLNSRVDFASFSAHKFQGPRGVGFLYKKQGKVLAPLLVGGGQEDNQRSGTENLPGIVAQARALRIELDNVDDKIAHLRRLQTYLYNSLQNYSKVSFFSEPTDYFAPHILCFGIKNVRGEVLVHAFEDKDIFISTTSACSSKKKNSFSTLGAMKVPEQIANTAVRVSFGHQNTIAEVEQFMIIFNQLYNKFSKINN